MEVFQGLTALKNSAAILNSIKKYADEIKDTQKSGELMRAIGELSLELGNAQFQLAQQMRENDQLTQDITELKKENEELRAPRGQLKLDKNNLLFSEDGVGPFCTACYYDRGKKMPLHNMMNIKLEALGQKSAYFCPACSAKYF